MNKDIKIIANRKTLCRVGLVNHAWLRLFTDDSTFVRCRSCKHVYHKDILGGTTCPRCQKEMKPEKHWYRKCKVCGLIA